MGPSYTKVEVLVDGEWCEVTCTNLAWEVKDKVQIVIESDLILIDKAHRCFVRQSLGGWVDVKLYPISDHEQHLVGGFEVKHIACQQGVENEVGDVVIILESTGQIGTEG